MILKKYTKFFKEYQDILPRDFLIKIGPKTFRLEAEFQSLRDKCNNLRERRILSQLFWPTTKYKIINAADELLN
jgi:uncharacterized protein (DUF2225 family)